MQKNLKSYSIILKWKRAYFVYLDYTTHTGHTVYKSQIETFYLFLMSH